MGIQERLSTILDLAALRRDAGEINYGEFVSANLHDMTEDELRGRSVMDVGANVGIFSLCCWALGAEYVLAVEANPDNFQRLWGYALLTPVIEPVNYAAFNGLVKRVSVMDEREGSRVSPSPEGAVEARSLRELIGMMSRSDDDMVLKVDTEGAEYDILLHAASEDIRRFRTIFLETHSAAHLGAHPARTAGHLMNYMAFLGYEIGQYKPYFAYSQDGEGRVVGRSQMPDAGFCKLTRI